MAITTVLLQQTTWDLDYGRTKIKSSPVLSIKCTLCSTALHICDGGNTSVCNTLALTVTETITNHQTRSGICWEWCHLKNSHLCVTYVFPLVDLFLNLALSSTISYSNLDIYCLFGSQLVTPPEVHSCSRTMPETMQPHVCLWMLCGAFKVFRISFLSCYTYTMLMNLSKMNGQLYYISNYPQGS